MREANSEDVNGRFTTVQAPQARGTGGTRNDPRDESAAERLDRNLDELTGELRVVVTGVQVLFAFLLVVPFDQRFARVDGFQRSLYFATLVLAGLAGALVLAPSAHHRLLFRHGNKRRIVAVANRMATYGIATMAVAIGGALGLVAAFLFGDAIGAIAVAVSCFVFATLWLLPAVMMSRDDG